MTPNATALQLRPDTRPLMVGDLTMTADELLDQDPEFLEWLDRLEEAEAERQGLTLWEGGCW